MGRAMVTVAGEPVDTMSPPFDGSTAQTMCPEPSAVSLTPQSLLRGASARW